MKALLIMQARTDSTRLPGKAMLPMGGYPSAVLAALRASNTGLEVSVATSTAASDDDLTSFMEQHHLRVVRGPLEDVLARFALAAKDLPEESIVVRLTGDNVVPDGNFVQELLAAFAAAGVDYLSQHSPQSRLPYGIGAEAFTVAALRRAHVRANHPEDREHVTPWIRRNCRVAMHTPRDFGASDLSHLRCTLDDEEDYQRLLRLFQEVDQPLRIGWLELAMRLAQLPGEPRFRVPYRASPRGIHSEMTLGTAQLGMEYGIVNHVGQPAQPTAVRMVRQAISHGVTVLDTARSYGTAESVLGDALAGAWRSRVEVVTKLDSLASLGHDAAPARVRAAVDESVKTSCEELRVPRISTLLLHRFQHYHAWGGAAWRRLLELQAEGEGTIGTLGASVYDPIEALQLLRDPAVGHLQIPMNVLDWRWKAHGVDRALMERPDVVVHARSALLQGLLISPAQVWPGVAEFDVAARLRRLRELADEFERESLADLCLAYVRSQPWISSVVVGCETPEQLQENLRLFCLPKLKPEQCAELESLKPIAPESLLNPSRWKIIHEQSAK